MLARHLERLEYLLVSVKRGELFRYKTANLSPLAKRPFLAPFSSASLRPIPSQPDISADITEIPGGGVSKRDVVSIVIFRKGTSTKIEVNQMRRQQNHIPSCSNMKPLFHHPKIDDPPMLIVAFDQSRLAPAQLRLISAH